MISTHGKTRTSSWSRNHTCPGALSITSVAQHLQHAQLTGECHHGTMELAAFCCHDHCWWSKHQLGTSVVCGTSTSTIPTCPNVSWTSNGAFINQLWPPRFAKKNMAKVTRNFPVNSLVFSEAFRMTNPSFFGGQRWFNKIFQYFDGNQKSH